MSEGLPREKQEASTAERSGGMALGEGLPPEKQEASTAERGGGTALGEGLPRQGQEPSTAEGSGGMALTQLGRRKIAKLERLAELSAINAGDRGESLWREAFK